LQIADIAYLDMNFIKSLFHPREHALAILISQVI